MEIQPIGSESLYIYICGEELEGFPMQSDDIGSEDAAEILKAALGEGFSEIWENAYLEMYSGRDELLLFARPHSGKPVIFAFPEIESVIYSARCCRESIISYLSLLGEEYYLILYPWRGKSPPEPFFEYGELCQLPPLFALHILEHGKILAGPAAIDEINSVF